MMIVYRETYEQLVAERPDQWCEGLEKLQAKQSKDADDTLLDTLKLQYSNLMHSTDSVFMDGDSLDDEYEEARNEFESDFVTMNCQVQNHRSDMHHLRDEVAFSQRNKEELEGEIKEKWSLCKLLEDRINEVKPHG